MARDGEHKLGNSTPDENSEKEVKRAVALKYEMFKDVAPRVVAKGERLLAEKIIALAKEHGVYVYEDPDLVVLLSKIEVGVEIPERLYRAVAEVLSFVYTLNGKMIGK